MNKTPIISLHDLHNAFGDNVIHDKLSMDIYPQEIIGLVGGSGTGKSVLLRTIIGLQKPSSGNIQVLGKDILSLSDHELLALECQWGVLFQGGALFSGLTVAQNIQVPLNEHTNLTLEEQQEIAQIKVNMVGLPPKAAHLYPSELSGGMVKRAALARALALDPKILFLDEPTSGLDPIAAADFDQLILDLQHSLRFTAVIITHDLDTLFTICDRVAVIVNKRIIIDTLPNLLKSEDPWCKSYFHGKRAQRFEDYYNKVE